MRKLITIFPLLLLASACSTVPVETTEYSPAEPQIVIRDANASGAIYQVSNNRFFFEDIRARRVGDVINVILDERTDATKTATTSANRGTSIGICKY